MRMLFGTDGIRGVAGDPPLDAATVFAVGAALGQQLKAQHAKLQVVIGQDTRESSWWIAESLTRGLDSAGVTAQSAGVITTPAVAFLARGGFAAGVVISASHNPWMDNGIKIFGHDGYKLSDELEEKLEGDIFALLHGQSAPPLAAAQVSEKSGPVEGDPRLLRDYVAWLASKIEGTSLRGLRALVDCANGAASPVAHEVFRACGLHAEFSCDSPTGRNINENCGAMHPKYVAEHVAGRGGEFDLGITFDGDADRALFSDRQGRVVNGDAVLLLAARDMKQRGRLRGDTVVATTMSNMGLEVALARSGIRMLRAPVGDKYVLEEMKKTGATLGGEQSGHIIFRDIDATTGDGLLTSLRVMEVMARSGQPLHELVADLKVYPQTIKNVRVKEKKPFADFPAVAGVIDAAEKELQGSGRVVVRYSGTEALARVMVEAESEDTMRRITDQIASAIERTLGI
ncbi:MAG TPA: phosphoglucosamine mutase [Terriglobales bacterium]|nr:phosphoglucosamine mutase [Terriglobales bacterium]